MDRGTEEERGSYHGGPTLEADAGLNAVAGFGTFLCAVVLQHRAGGSEQGQLTCELERDKRSNVSTSCRRGVVGGNSSP